MNKFEGIGNLATDIKLSSTSNDVPVCNFVMAFDTRIDDGKKETAFVKCVVWDTGALTFSKMFVKGSRVRVTGRIQTNKRMTVEGKTIFETVLRISHFNDLSTRNKPAEKAEIKEVV